MFRLTQRVQLVVVAAFIFAILYFYYPRQSFTLSRASTLSRCSSTPPKVPYEPHTHTRYKWRTVVQKYPVKNFTSLPSDPPGQLPRIQHDFTTISKQRFALLHRRRSEVKKTFKRSWKSYKAIAWMQDELAPITGVPKNPFGGWGATLVDTLDTLWIMDMKEEFEHAVKAAVTIDFDPEKSESQLVNIFETTIRYLGGFLSAYDLTECQDQRLLDKAVEIGDMIYMAFDTQNRMPATRWSPRAAAGGQETEPSQWAIIAEVGSLSLEFTRLSQLTGDMKWYDAIQRIADIMDAQQNETNIPGLWPVACNLRDLDFFSGPSFSLGAMADSAYEYLPKMYALLNGQGAAQQYEQMYKKAMDAAIENLFFRPLVPDNADILVSGQAYASGAIIGDISKNYEGQHLTCFVGGMLALGGRLFSNSTHVELGRKLTDGCVWAYQNTPTGIMPETFTMDACPDKSACTFDKQHWWALYGTELPPGFTGVNDARYLLRPEAIESVFYLYRITGDSKLQDIAWEMFQAIERHTKTELANAALVDVFQKGLGKSDTMESFWTAETLKYFYLIFSEPDLVNLNAYVFNTEAHPLKISRS